MDWLVGCLRFLHTPLTSGVLEVRTLRILTRQDANFSLLLRPTACSESSLPTNALLVCIRCIRDNRFPASAFAGSNATLLHRALCLHLCVSENVGQVCSISTFWGCWRGPNDRSTVARSCLKCGNGGCREAAERMFVLLRERNCSVNGENDDDDDDDGKRPLMELRRGGRCLDIFGSRIGRV